MVSGVRYRVASVGGVVAATVVAVLIANASVVQKFATTAVPVLSRLQQTLLAGEELWVAVPTTVVVVTATLAPLYKPQPRRILNLVYHTQRLVLIAGLILAAVGYFDYSYRLPRTTLLLTIGVLLVVLPAWLLAIRNTPDGDAENVIVVGDDPEEIERVIEALEQEPIGYVAPSALRGVPQTDGGITSRQEIVSDDHEYLGGLSRLEDVLVDVDVDTAAFAFSEINRQEFFGALETCHNHGVDAKVHRERTDNVLVKDVPGTELVDVDLEPWDWQDRALKRAFDIGFALGGLVVLLPIMAVIATAIKLEDGGPVFYMQERTAEMGNTFKIYKLRSMVPDSEDIKPGNDEDQITDIGRILRRTHLDEIPQLWTVLMGEMSVVGPRAAWVDEEHLLEDDVESWRQRWFVRPGLTGLAQINNITSKDPKTKLRYDLKYIRQQSFRYDVAIIVRQIWSVLGDVVGVEGG